MSETTEYKVVTTVEEIRDYIGDADVVAFDYERLRTISIAMKIKRHWIRQRVTL